MAKKSFRWLMAVALVILAGCATESRIIDSKNPDIVISSAGVLTYRGERVDAEDLPGLLRDAGYSGAETVAIRVPSSGKGHLRMAYYVMGVLAQKGFRRPILMEERRSYSQNGKIERKKK